MKLKRVRKSGRGCQGSVQIGWGRDPRKVDALVARMRKPARRLGGVSDMHIERMEQMTEDELLEVEMRDQ